MEWRPEADVERFETLIGGLEAPVVPMPELRERELQTQMRAEGRTAGQAEDWDVLRIQRVLLVPCQRRRGPMGLQRQALLRRVLGGHRIHWQEGPQHTACNLEGLPLCRVGATSRGT